jgi:hypothetical protein
MLKTFTIQIQSALTGRIAELEERLIKSVKGERRNNSYKLEIAE